jgi:DNA-binding HxlR family transcriptional regulator
MGGYGQFCPVAKAMELLDERWTMLVVRELLQGSQHFNTLQRGLPRMSPALLSTRLRTLARAGVIERYEDGNRVSYALTPAGKELRPIVEALGQWGTRWMPDLGDEDLDPHLLMWDVKRTIPVADWPRGRTVVAIRFADVAPPVSRWWVCVAGDEVDICDVDPGFDVTATVRTSLRAMTEIWRGDRAWVDALRAGRVEVEAPREVARAVPGWIGQSTLAAVPRPA